MTGKKIELTAIMMMSDTGGQRTAFFESAGAEGVSVQVNLDRMGKGGQGGYCRQHLTSVTKHWGHTPGFADGELEEGRRTRDIRAYVKRIMDEARQGLVDGGYAKDFVYVVMEAGGSGSLLPNAPVAEFDQAWPADKAEELPAAISMVASS